MASESGQDMAGEPVGLAQLLSVRGVRGEWSADPLAGRKWWL